MTVREATPNPNNQDALVYALYLLGGADREVDVEDIYLKCFAIAPARLGWRTRPDIPDYKKTSKALQSVEAKELPGLLEKPNALARRLTTQGADWVTRNRPTLEKLYGSGVVVPGVASGVHEMLRRDVRKSVAWELWTEGESPTRIDLADALTCAPGSPEATWRMRIEDVRRAARVLQDEQLEAFADITEQLIAADGKGK